MTRAELKKSYVEAVVTESFNNSVGMRKHFEKEISRVVEISKGYLIAIDKPHIEKDFCFGYSLSRYDTESYDEANDMAHKAKTDTDYFMQENIKQITDVIKALNKYNLFVRTHYIGAPEDTKIKCIEFVDDYSLYTMSEKERAKLKKLSEEDKQLIIEAYNEELKDFEKRLASYLKRYGMSKVNTWSYWQDA